MSVWIVASLSLGIAGNLLLQTAQTVGFNLAILFFLLGLGSVGILRTLDRWNPRSEASGWITTGVLLTTCTFLFRDAPSLHVLAFLGGSAAFAFATLEGGRDWLRQGGLTAPIEAVTGTLLHTLMGPLPYLKGRFIRGAVVTAPLLLLFGALLAEADPIFAGHLNRLVSVLVPAQVREHLILTATLSWFASGYLSGLGRGTRFFQSMTSTSYRPRSGAFEVNLALSMVALLLMSFLIVQFYRLFGGSDVIADTPGLTYAEYARDGFTQLIVAVTLILPLLLMGQWLVQREAEIKGTRMASHVRRFRWLAGIHVFLLLLLAASAASRVHLYQSIFGLTESRLYAVVFLGWLMLAALWLGLEMIRDERYPTLRFPLILAVAVIVTLVIASPDTLVAKNQLERGDALDPAYLASLSADAMPVIARGFHRLSPQVQEDLRNAWLERWGESGPKARTWHSWNWAEGRGIRAYDHMMHPSLSPPH